MDLTRNFDLSSERRWDRGMFPRIVLPARDRVRLGDPPLLLPSPSRLRNLSVYERLGTDELIKSNPQKLDVSLKSWKLIIRDSHVLRCQCSSDMGYRGRLTKIEGKRVSGAVVYTELPDQEFSRSLRRLRCGCTWLQPIPLGRKDNQCAPKFRTRTALDNAVANPGLYTSTLLETRVASRPRLGHPWRASAGRWPVHQQYELHIKTYNKHLLRVGSLY